MSKTLAPVSAVIPGYNGEAFITETIESVRAQTHPVAEILMVDDGSTDRTAEIARRMGVRVISQSNTGLAAARNRCVRESSQPWIAFIDSDDIWEPEKIERQMRLVEVDPEIAVVTCDYSLFDQFRVITASTIQQFLSEYERQPKTKSTYGAVIENLDYRFRAIAYFLVPSMVLMRRDVLNQTGGFDEQFSLGEDFDCFMRMLANHKLGVVETVLARRRDHPHNASHRYTEAGLSCVATTRKVLEHPDLYPVATVRMCRDALPANLRHAGARLVWSGQTKRGQALLLESARLELSLRTMLALGTSVFPTGLGRQLMNARYYVSGKLGI